MMATILDFIGLPYEPTGTPPAGADCWTLAKAYAAQVLGQDWPPYMYDKARYMEEAQILIDSEISNLGERWEKVETPEHGDLLIFRVRGYPIHCAVYLGRGEILHTLKGRNSCVEPLPVWAERLVGIYRWKGSKCKPF